MCFMEIFQARSERVDGGRRLWHRTQVSAQTFAPFSGSPCGGEANAPAANRAGSTILFTTVFIFSS
jgi:hypothetical protein